MITAETYRTSIEDCLERSKDTSHRLRKLLKRMEPPTNPTDPGLPGECVAEDLGMVQLNAKVIAISTGSIIEVLNKREE